MYVGMYVCEGFNGKTAPEPDSKIGLEVTKVRKDSGWYTTGRGMRELKTTTREREGGTGERKKTEVEEGPGRNDERAEKMKRKKQKKILDGRHKIQTPRDRTWTAGSTTDFLLNIKKVPIWVGRATDQSRDKRIGPLSSSPSLS